MSEISKLNGYDLKDATSRNDISNLKTVKIQTFENVQSMKNDTNLLVGMHVKTQGYYSSGDGGYAEYIIKENSNGYYEELNNELVAELIIDKHMTPEQFGAYGDDTHDDTLAIQNAINYSKNVIFKNTYKTTDQITISNACNLIGNDSTINSTLSGKKSVFKVLCSNVNFEGLTINLTYNGGGSTGEDGCTICYGTYHMTLPLDIKNSIIRNCNIKRTGTLSYNIGIFGDTHNIIIENSKLYGECINLHWSGDFDETSPDTSPCTITYHPHNVIIRNNILENNRGVFISSAYNVEILNNKFSNNTYPITLSIGDYGNTLADNSEKEFIMTGIKIENCDFKEYQQECIRALGYGARSGDLEHNKNYITTSKAYIKNCTFEDSTQNSNKAIIGAILFYGLNIEDCYFKTTNRKNAIYVNPLFNSNIKNCLFDIAGTPITIFGGDNIKVEKCKATIGSGYNFVRATQYTFDFTEQTYQVHNLIIENNDVNGATTLISLDYTNNAIIRNNNLLICNIGININTNNKNISIYNNVFSDSSDTFVGAHNNIISNNCDRTIVKDNKFNGACGIFVKANTTFSIISDNCMLNNPYNGNLCSVESRSDKKVYMLGNIVDSNASLVYGSNYSYIDYTENV